MCQSILNSIFYVKNFLGHKSLRNTEIYINIEHTLFDKYDDVFTVKVVDKPEEIKSLIEHLKILGITDVLSLYNEGVESCLINKEVESFKVNMKSKIKLQFHHQPIPVSIEVVGRHDAFQVGFQLAIKKLNNIFFNDPKAKVLIHCTAGIDRAPFLAASYLARSNHLEIADVYREIKKVRPSVIEHLEWVW